MAYCDRSVWDALKLTRYQSLPANIFWRAFSPTFIKFGEQEEWCAKQEADMDAEFEREWQSAIEHIFSGTTASNQSRTIASNRLRALDKNRGPKGKPWEFVLPQTKLLHAWLAFRMAEAAAKQPFTSNPIQIEGGDNSQMNSLLKEHYTPDNRDAVEANLDDDAKAIGLWMVDYIRTKLMPLINKATIAYCEKTHSEIPEFFPLKRTVYHMTSGDYWHNPEKRECTDIASGWLRRTIRGSDAELACASAIDVFIEYAKDVRHLSTHIEFVKELYRFFDEN